MKFFSNLAKMSDRFLAPPSPSGVSAATSALFTSFVKEDVYKANVEHVTMSLENAYFRQLESQWTTFTTGIMTYIQQFRTGKHALLHACVEKVDVIAH